MIKRITTLREVQNGFTLVELLTVISIASILAILSLPAVQGLQKAGSFNKAVYTMADSLQFARSYAMSQNTYVYVGLTEVARSQDPGVNPQTAGVGRVAMSIVATRDGVSDAATWSTAAATGGNIIQVRPVQTFDFLHISTNPFPAATTGNMARLLNVTPANISSITSVTPTTPFSLPLGSAVGSGKYNFNNLGVICFNPQGEVLMNGSAVQWLEIDIQPMVGMVTPPTVTNANQGNQAALVVDGVAGAVTVYRP
jgi:prepilin-type N-terminal cleavage/methylation domain-containing protein